MGGREGEDSQQSFAKSEQVFVNHKSLAYYLSYDHSTSLTYFSPMNYDLLHYFPNILVLSDEFSFYLSIMKTLRKISL